MIKKVDEFSIMLIIILKLTVAGEVFSQVDWQTDLNFQSENANLTLSFGGSTTGTDGFDIGLDILSPPPPPSSYYACFQITDPTFTDLMKDIRAWISPYETIIDWTIEVSNAEGIETTLSWDPAELPAEGTFILTCVSNTDMRENDSITFTDNRTLTVKFIPIAAPILGDVNNDEIANSTDALIVLSCDVDMPIPQQFCPMNCGDVNFVL